VGFTPETATRTRTPPAPGSAGSLSTSDRTDEGPDVEYTTAFTVVGTRRTGDIFHAVGLHLGDLRERGAGAVSLEGLVDPQEGGAPQFPDVHASSRVAKEQFDLDGGIQGEGGDTYGAAGMPTLRHRRLRRAALKRR
jgi:hypothetical protein